VPYDVAFSLSPDERKVWVVVMARFDGRIFDWGTSSWVV